MFNINEFIENNYFYKKYGLNIQLIKKHLKLINAAYAYQCKQGYSIDLTSLINDYFIEKQRYSEIEFSKDHIIYDNLSSVSIASYLRYGDYSNLAGFTPQYKRLIFSDYQLWQKQYKRLNSHEFKLYIDTLPVNTMASIDVIVQSINSQYNTELLTCEDIIEYICEYANTDYLHIIREKYFLLCQIFRTDIDKETVYLRDLLNSFEFDRNIYDKFYFTKVNELSSEITPFTIDNNTLNSLFIPNTNEPEFEQTEQTFESLAIIDDGEFWE